MKDIFISYRRADSAHITGRIYDNLKAEFGVKRVFKDVESIPLGADFRTEVDREVGRCKVLLAVIGEKWLTEVNEDGSRRIEAETDSVRIEIESALKRKIPVVPILVRGAKIPSEKQLPNSLKGLSFRNGLPVRPDPDFRNDMGRLCDQVRTVVGGKRKREKKKRSCAWIPLFIFLALAGGAYMKSDEISQYLPFSLGSGVELKVEGIAQRIQINDTVTYLITVKNRSKTTLKNVELTCDYRDSGTYSEAFPTHNIGFSINSGEVRGFSHVHFAPIPEIRPGESKEWQVGIKAARSGEFLFTTKMTHSGTKEGKPVVARESTYFSAN